MMQKMVNRLLGGAIEECPKSVLLLGPRQSGKSTLIHSLKPDLTVDLSSEVAFLDHHARPELLEEWVQEKKPRTVFIDEVQRIPSILNTVQSIIDRSKRQSLKTDKAPIKFYLSGSSARKLRRGGANLLPGRIISFELGPLVAAEMREPLNVAQAMAFGTLPEVYTLGHSSLAEQLLKTYASTYVKEEIQAEIQLRTLSGFVRFLQAAAEQSGTFLDLSKIAKQAKVPRQSAVRYFEILEDTLIAHRLGPCTFAPGVDLVKHPRYFFFDVGVLNGLLNDFSLGSERKGRLFEHLVFSQIHYTSKALRIDIEIQNFRTRGGTEVDFVFRWKDRIIAVECKSSETVDTSDVRSLHTFAKAVKGKSELFLVCPDVRMPRRMGEARVLGLNAFLDALMM